MHGKKHHTCNTPSPDLDSSKYAFTVLASAKFAAPATPGHPLRSLRRQGGRTLPLLRIPLVPSSKRICRCCYCSCCCEQRSRAACRGRRQSSARRGRSVLDDSGACAQRSARCVSASASSRCNPVQRRKLWLVDTAHPERFRSRRLCTKRMNDWAKLGLEILLALRHGSYHPLCRQQGRRSSIESKHTAQL